jgi:fido (protein-threonine AMPylation protein)
MSNRVELRQRGRKTLDRSPRGPSSTTSRLTTSSLALRSGIVGQPPWSTRSDMKTDVAATRFHHGLVHIHPFPNGNGLHSRELTDLVLLAVGAEQFTWGIGHLGPVSETRRAYVKGLQAADSGDYGELLSFARS